MHKKLKVKKILNHNSQGNMAMSSKWLWQETSARLGNNASDNLKLGAKKEIFHWHKHFSNFFPVYEPPSLQTHPSPQQWQLYRENQNANLNHNLKRVVAENKDTGDSVTAMKKNHTEKVGNN